MGRILSIDYGAKRSGIAVTDPLRLIATALATVPSRELIPFLKTYFQNETVDEAVIGLPKQLNNTDSALAPLVREFMDLFRQTFPIPLTAWDERFTTRIAQQVLLKRGKKKMARREKGLLDRISATLILQEYMNAKKQKELGFGLGL